MALGEAAFVSGQEATTSAISRMTEDLRFLSSDDLAGRGVGTDGIARAGSFIAERFSQLGIKTDSFDGQPFQNFFMPGPAQLGKAEHNRLSFLGVDDLGDLELGQDFTPVSLGSSGEFSGELAFVGYGITAPELNYDDYAGLNVEGKVVIVLRKEPSQDDPNSKFDGTRPSPHAFFSTKELNATLHKAAALIIVNDRVTTPDAANEKLPQVSEAGKAATEAQLPTVYCSRSVIDRIIRSYSQTTLEKIEAAIDQSAAPQSFVLTGVTARGETQIVESQIPVRNVVGFLPGAGELATQYVVIGAHYDHVGMGGVGSLAPGTIEVHNGADDNASGTTALLEVARQLSVDRTGSRRSFIFIAFTGEESGLLGSKHYCRNPRWPLEDTVAMLNMDMVGRLESNTLTVYGTGTATEFESMVDRLNVGKLTIDKQPAGLGPSDHASFYEVKIPVFHFFTGLHNDYHRPSDDFEKANIEGMDKIVQFVAAIAREISESSVRPTLIQTSAVAQIGRGPRRPRAILGVRLDANNSSASIAEVAPGGAAEAAGLKAGDVIVQIAGNAINTTRELQSVLAEKKPGDTVNVTIQRGNDQLSLEITLQAN